MAMLAPSAHDFSHDAAGGPDSSVGRPIRGVQLQSRDDHGGPLPAGRIGEVWMHGAGAMLGYWQDPHATAHAMRDGWVRTGDLGYVDDQGYVHLVGRVKEVINRGGQKVFPAEVEAVLASHPNIKDAGVVAVSDPDWGEVPYAFVVAVARSDDLIESVRQLARQRLAPYKLPVAFELVEELPRNPAGKLLRRVLSERVHERA
jgi:acyl-CoA synthetase (AMP-forming)/AMP-acid ligase II